MHKLPSLKQFLSKTPLERYEMLFRLQAQVHNVQQKAHYRQIFTNTFLYEKGKPLRYPDAGILKNFAGVQCVCQSCGTVFSGYSRSQYCVSPACQAVRKEKRKQAKKFRLRGSTKLT